MQLRLAPTALALCLSTLSCAPRPAPTVPPLATAGRTIPATAAPTSSASLSPATPSPSPLPSLSPPFPPPAAWTPAERLPLIPLAPPPPGDLSPDGLRLIDRVGREPGNVLVDGRRAFVHRDQRLQVIDLSDPASAATFDAGPIGPDGPTLLPGGLANMAVHGDRLYGLVDWDRTVRDGAAMPAWLVTLDAADERAIRVLSVVQLPIGTGRATANGESALIALDGDIVVVTGSEGPGGPDGSLESNDAGTGPRHDVLATVDTSDPHAPKLHALMPLSGTLVGAAVDGRTMYILARHDDLRVQNPALADASASLTAIDLRDPAAPRMGQPARFARPAIDVHLVSGRAVVLSPGIVDVFALDDPSAPVAIANSAPATATPQGPGWPTAVPRPTSPLSGDYTWYMRPGAQAVVEGPLACVPGLHGMDDFDLSDVDHPRLTTHVPFNDFHTACPARFDGRPVDGLAYSQDGELQRWMPDDTWWKLKEADVERRLASATRAAEFVAANMSAPVTTDGQRLMTEVGGRIYTFDERARPAVRVWPNALPEGAWRFAASRTRFAAAFDEAIQIFDALDPAQRTVTGTVAISSTHLAFDGTMLFIAVEERRLSLDPERYLMLAAIDTSDAARPFVVDRLPLEQDPVSIAAGQGHVFVSTWDGLAAYALVGGRSLTKVGATMDFMPSGLALQWPFLLVGGLTVLDVSTPSAPQVIAQHRLAFRPWQCPPSATCHYWPAPEPVTWRGSSAFVGDPGSTVWTFDTRQITRQSARPTTP